MKYKIMPRIALSEWIERLQKSYRVVGPRHKHGQFVFAQIDNPDELVLHYPTSVLPPKKYLVPQRELLFKYRLDGTRVEAAPDPEPTVVLGIHTCDIHAIKLFDRIFSQGFTDQHYQAHRENTVLVSIECMEPCSENSFCRDMGTVSASSGFDLHIVDMGKVYAFQVGTARGEALLHGFHQVFDALDSDLHQINRRLSEKWQHFPYRLDFELHEMPALLSRSFQSELWEELGERCLACGMCTQVCPTCYCFDVSDEVDLAMEEGSRIRRWDSCQINEFAMVAGGHNFREQLAARQRHRFMRKGKYQMDAYDMVGCVGCGRCATACLVNIRPIDVFNQLHARAQEPALAEEVVL